MLAAVVALAAAVVNLSAVAPAWATRPVFVVVHVVMSAALAVGGVALATDPALLVPGAWLVGAAFLQVVPVLSWHDVGALPLLSWVFGPVTIVPIGAVLFAYPGGRVTGSRERWWLRTATLWLCGGRAVLALFPPATPVRGWWPTVLDHPGARAVLDAVFNVGALLLIVGFVVILAGRWRRSGSLDRVAEAPLGVATVALGVSAATHLLEFLTSGETKGAWAAVVQDLALTAIPLAFIAVSLVRRLLYASVADALRSLPPAPTPAQVHDALCSTMHDPDVELLYWVDGSGYVDAGGTPRERRSGSDRLELPCDASDGSPLALVRVDPMLHRYPELLASTLRLSTLALENTRLQAALLAQMQEISASRARIVEAGIIERRRIERDLHDGAQQGLLAVSASLGLLLTLGVDSQVREGVERSRTLLRASLRQLRELAHGIHPALLTDAGLGPAVASVAELSPIPVQMSIPDRRWPQSVEETAYFVVCECLSNAAKHAHATTIQVRADTDDTGLCLVVMDDGIGGVTTGNGSGLRGLDDRVTALGGYLGVISPPGAGTRIDVRLPCE